MPDAPIFVDGVIVAWNARAGVGSVSLDDSITHIPFGRSAIDDADRDLVRAGCRRRFALSEERRSHTAP